MKQHRAFSKCKDFAIYMGYKIDVKEVNPGGKWESLECQIQEFGSEDLGQENITCFREITWAAICGIDGGHFLRQADAGKI